MKTTLDLSAPTPSETLRFAITNAVSGDDIVFDSSQFNSTALPITLDADLPAITGDITITGFTSHKGYVKVDGDGFWAAFSTAKGATDVIIRGLTVRNTLGSAVRVAAGDVLLSSLDLHDNSTTGGGPAIDFTGTGALSIYNSTFTDNISDGDGGAVRMTSAGTLALSKCTFTNNTAGGRGGAIAATAGGAINLTDVSLTGCTAGTDGGAIAIDGATLTANTLSISDSVATLGHGGGLYALNSATTLKNSTFDNDTALEAGFFTFTTAGVGGAIAADGGTLTLTTAKITDCSATISGGGIDFQSGASDLLTISGLEMANCNLTGGAGIVGGGGINVTLGSLDLREFNIDNCDAGTVSYAGRGGGICMLEGDTLFLTGTKYASSITNCHADEPGGAVFFGGDLANVVNLSISNCDSNYGGGGLACGRSANCAKVEPPR